MKSQQLHTINRRRFLRAASLLTGGFCLSPKWNFGQPQSPVITITNAAKTAKITVTSLRGNISVLEGSGGNIAVLNGSEGKLMVDAGIGVSKPNVLAALNSISTQPIKWLINSHWHFDHANGNEWVHDEGATIIAQDITRNHLSTTTRVDDWNYTFPPLAAGGLPVVLYKNDYNLDFNGEKIKVKVYPHAHTDCDSSIFFPNANILHVADTFWNGYFPFIDYSTGGSIDGMIKAAKMNIDHTTNETIVIPGHGPIGNRQQLIEFHEMLSTIRSKVSTLKKQGKSVAEVVDAKPTAAYDAKFGGFVIDGKFFTRLVYKGV